jgi:hypothetical protein
MITIFFLNPVEYRNNYLTQEKNNILQIFHITAECQYP